MAKKSKKRLPRWRKVSSSCMWGLISMFDFRQGHSTQRILSGKKHGRAGSSGVSYSRNNGSLLCNIVKRHEDDESLSIFSETDAEEIDRINLGMASTTSLMEEMSSETYPELCCNIEWKTAELGHGPNTEKNNNETTVIGLECSKNQENCFSASQSLIYQQSGNPNVSEILSPNLDLSAFLAGYYKSGFQCKVNHLEYKNKSEYCPFPENVGDINKNELVNESLVAFQEAIIDLTVAYLRQESMNSSKLVGRAEIQQPKELTNALEMLDSNKDLLLKLLQDPDSSIRKHMQDLQNVYFSRTSGQNQSLGEPLVAKQLQKQSDHFFIRKRDKGPLENLQPNRIIVLKPSPARNQNPANTVSKKLLSHALHRLENKSEMEKFSSHFSLKEIKRRLRNAVGANRKDRHPIAMDGILHKIPYGKEMAAECGACRSEAIENGKKEASIKEVEMEFDLSVASKIVSERKKLSKNSAQVVYREAAFYDEARKHLAELLRISSESASLPAIEVSKTLGRMLSFPGFNYLSPRLSPTREKDSVDKSVFVCNSSKELNPEQYEPSELESLPDVDKSHEAKNEIEEATEAEDFVRIEEDGQLDTLAVSFATEVDLPSGTSKEDEFSELLQSEHSKEKFQPSIELTHITSSSVKTQESRDAECATENASRPSPISVLERLFFEDVNSPSSIISENVINAVRQTQTKEPHIVSSTSVSDSIDPEACMEFDEASIFDELEISYGLLINDPKLLFDSIDEVLAEIKLMHFRCTPWVLFIWPNLRSLLRQEDFIKEACRRINWHLDVQFPSTLEQAMRRDLDGRVWIDLQFDAEDTINEIGNEILDHLFEEIALEMWD